MGIYSDYTKAGMLYQPWGLLPETGAVSGEPVTTGDNGELLSEVGSEYRTLDCVHGGSVVVLKQQFSPTNRCHLCTDQALLIEDKYCRLCLDLR